MRDRIRRLGPIPFDTYVELALYGEEGGFYSSVGEAGTGRGEPGTGHFLTSPELGPLFGEVVSRALDGWWLELGSPDPFVVVEAAAGAGSLAKAVLSARPRCSAALRYLLVERSERLRERQATAVALEPASTVLGPVAPSDEDGTDGARVLPGGGPRVASLSELPAGPFNGVILANELADNLAFSLFERGPLGWLEVRVGEDGDSGDLVEVLTPASAADAKLVTRLAPEAEVGARIPLQAEVTAWLREALHRLRRGRVVLIDYASTTPELSRRPSSEWLRTYRRGGRGGGALERPGSQDITVEVCVDQLARVQRPAIDRPQHEFLAANGIHDMVDEARAAWSAAAAAPDLAALRSRSRVTESAALLDPSGLGAFRVLEWLVP